MARIEAIENQIKESKLWLELQQDVYNSGIIAEFCEFYLEHPDLSLEELYRQFRDEWDL
jgi:DNA-binding transcriptional regulator WhiA